MLFMLLLIILASLILAYFYGKHKHSFFKNTGIKYLEPPLPFFGTNVTVFLGKENLTEYIKRLYDAYPDQKYIGIFDGLKPALVLRDPELIKMIGIKEFDTFHDHKGFVEEDHDMFGKLLFALKGLSWKDMRSTLSPAFSSSKMRNMFAFVEQSAKNMSEHFLERLKTEDMVEIEAKDAFSKYTVDTIATTAFGIELDSFKNETNEFYRLAKLMSSFNIIRLLKAFVVICLPKIAKIFRLSLSSPKAVNFFKDLVTSSIKNREVNNIVRPDMIHLLMEAKNGRLAHDKMLEDISYTGFATVEESDVGKERVRRKWSDEYLTAQAFLFFAAGFDTTSNFLAFFFYEIARHPEVQRKLQDEIEQVISETGDKIIYNNLFKLKYLDMCVSETMRIWPIAPVVDRQASKDFVFESPSENSNITYEMKAGQILLLPIYALHHDPQYYPNPERFDPERFSDENKSKINSCTFLPFGIGPRNCIGSRYALMVVKAVIFHILANFDVVTTNKTEIPVKLENSPFSLRTKNGVWIGLKNKKK